MKEIFLKKLGEIVLKGANKRQFESRLRQNVRRRMKAYGNFDVYIMQSTVYVEPMDEMCDVDGAWEACRSIFGVVSLCRCRPCEKNVDAIFEAVEAYLGDELDCAKSFKVESKRSDKRFPLTSIGISQAIGGRLAEAHPDCRVDVHNPAYTVYVEIPQIVEGNVTRDTVSHLENEYAKSDAIVDGEFLWHTLETKPQEKIVEIVKEIEYIDREIEKKVEVVKYLDRLIEAEDTRFEKTQKTVFWMVIACVITDILCDCTQQLKDRLNYSMDKRQGNVMDCDLIFPYWEDYEVPDGNE